MLYLYWSFKLPSPIASSGITNQTTVSDFDGHILEAGKGVKASFIGTSIWQAKEFLSKGFRWVIGDGQSVVATRDAWLTHKSDFKVDKLQMYEGTNETVSTLFYQVRRSGILTRFMSYLVMEMLKLFWPRGYLNVMLLIE